MLSVLRRFIDSGYHFGIFKLFLLSTMPQLISMYLGSSTGFCVGMLLKLRWFSPNPPIFSTIGGTNKTYPNDIAEILLKLVLNTIKQTNKHIIPNLPLLYFPTFPSCGLCMFNATIEYIALKAKTTSQTFSYNLFIKLLS